MNRTYRLVWNDGCRAWIPVGENAKARGKCRGVRALRRLGAIAAVMLALPAAAKTIADDALPTGFKVVRGSGSDSRSGNVYTVTQDGQRGVFGFDSFDIGSAATVNVKQGAGAAALFVIGGSDASHIYGKFNADATVFLSNPNGMVFGRGAQINVGGMLATTMSMDAGEFMDGRYRLTNPGSGTIYNDSIDFKAAGSVALIANTVENAGKIAATTVTMAAGNTVAIDLTGNGLIRARVEEPALRARIANLAGGEIAATLAVTLTAGQARDTLDRVVNNSGTIRATGLVERGGEILLEGGLVTNGGTLDASSATGAGGRVDVLGRNVALEAGSRIDVSGAATGGTAYVLGDMKAGRADIDGHIYAKGGTGDGGFIETSAADVRIAKGFRVKALSAYGRAGKWLIDPVNFTIYAGSGTQTVSGMGADTLSMNLEEANMTIQTDASTSGDGDIFVNGAVSWTQNTTLTLSAHRNILINANITATGNSAGLKLFYGGSNATTAAAANTDYSIGNGAGITLSGAAATLWVANHQYELIHTEDQLVALSGLVNASGYYALGNDLNFGGYDAYGYGFKPIGTGYSNQFLGRFDGLGHKISNLNITGCHTSACNVGSSSFAHVGLFGYVGTGAVIRDVGLQNILVATDSKGYYAINVGTLAGTNYGRILNSWASGTINSTKAEIVGGLVGANMNSGMYGSLISDSYANVTVHGGNDVGGLIGFNSTNSVVRNSYATGHVTAAPAYDGAKNYDVGGLVGYNMGVIEDSYATGNVTGNSVYGAGYHNVGGLVGLNEGDIEDSYAEGDVSATSAGSYATGGLVGGNTGSILRSHASGSVNGRDKTGGLAGYNDKGTISDSYAEGAVWASFAQYVGGLVGWNGGNSGSWGLISNSYATGIVFPDAESGSTVDWVGGLVGYNAAHGKISDSYATGTVAVLAGSNVGGLVGGNAGIVERSHAGIPDASWVIGSTNVGGLVGYNLGTGQIIDSYSSQEVGVNDLGDVAGGLVGRNEGTVIRSFAMSPSVLAPVAGGLIGKNFSNDGTPASVQDSFWYSGSWCQGGYCANGIGDDATGGANVANLDAAGMKDMANYLAAGWDISNDASGTSKWLMIAGKQHPTLRSSTVISVAEDGGDVSGLLPVSGGETTNEAPLVTTSTTGEETKKKKEIAEVAAVVVKVESGKSDEGRDVPGKPMVAALGSTGDSFVPPKNDEGVAPPEKPKGRMLVCRKG